MGSFEDMLRMQQMLQQSSGPQPDPSSLLQTPAGTPGSTSQGDTSGQDQSGSGRVLGVKDYLADALYQFGEKAKDMLGGTSNATPPVPAPPALPNASSYPNQQPYGLPTSPDMRPSGIAGQYQDMLDQQSRGVNQVDPLSAQLTRALSGSNQDVSALTQSLARFGPGGQKIPQFDTSPQNLQANLPQRLSTVRGFLSNILGSAAAAGYKHVGLPTPLEQQMGMQKLQNETLTAQSGAAENLARGRYYQNAGQQFNLVQVGTNPDGSPVYMQQKDVGGYQKQLAAKRFQTTAGGLYDTQTRQMIPDTGAGIRVTPEIQQQYGLSADWLGKPIKLTDLASLEKAQASQYTVTQGAQGPATVNKVQGTAQDLGLGNPRQVSNDIAAGRLRLSQMQFERDTFGTLFGQSVPSSLIDANGNTIGWKSPSSPTMNERQQGQQAQDLHVLFGQVKDEINRLDGEGKLGPISGRINEVMTGRIGADDPEFAKLRALGSLTSSGMLKAHFGARGGQEMYKHFQNLFDTGKMTAGDLMGALDGFDTFMSQYATRAATAGGDLGGGNIFNPPKNPPNKPPNSGGAASTLKTLPVGGGRQMDTQTAQQFLNAAGGNKDTARKWGTLKGWKF